MNNSIAPTISVLWIILGATENTKPLDMNRVSFSERENDELTTVLGYVEFDCIDFFKCITMENPGLIGKMRSIYSNLNFGKF